MISDARAERHFKTIMEGKISMGDDVYQTSAAGKTCLGANSLSPPVQQTDPSGKALGANEEVVVMDPRGLCVDQENVGEDPGAQSDAPGLAHHPGWRLSLEPQCSSFLLSGTFCNL